MHGPGRRDPWWLEAFVLTRAVFGILFWPIAAIIGVMIAIAGLFVAFDEGLLWGLLVLGAIGAAVAVFAWWDRRRPPQL